MLEFAQQLGGSYISMEGALWRTLWRLLIPGQLTLEFLAGRRRRFVLPIRLYLTISVITLLAIKLVSLQQIDAHGTDIASHIVTMDQVPGQDDEIISVGQHRAGFRAGAFYCQNLPDALCARIEQRLVTNRKVTVEELKQMPDRVVSYMSTAMFLLVPIFGLFLKLVYVDKRMYYTEHLVFALHVHAFWFAMVLLMLPQAPGLSTAAGVATLLYPLIALHRVYMTRWWSTLLRALAMQMVYLFTLTLVVMAIVFLTLFN